MKRRDFLKCTLVTAGTLIVGSACDDGGSDPSGGGGAGGGGPDPDGGPLPDGGPQPDAAPGRMLLPGERYFPQSVMSGDPRPDGVILWTRVEDPDRADADIDVELELALDEGFAQPVPLDDAARRLVAEPTWDHCVKARLVGLQPATYYYYRFVVRVGDAWYVSRTGRTKTAPAPDADVPVRFAAVSCQDYNGRYYNTWRRLTALEVDFVLHLGDYVYETTGDRAFQDVNPDRTVRFRNPEEAIVFHEGTENEYYAARSLGNYRDLYRTFRSDPDLQRAHERFPLIPVWDDHEFSDDCHGANATYFDGERDELDVDRRKAANQAWFEYMPVDYADAPDFRYDPAAAFPGDLRIWRDLEFGRHVHVVMTDLRTYRSDHLIPEDAFPGAVAVTQEALEAALGEIPDIASAYVDVETYADGLYANLLRAEGYGDDVVRGPMSAVFINGVVEAANEGRDPAEQIAPIDVDDPDLPRGLAWHHCGKRGRYGAVGSRYLVVEEAFDILARVRWAETGGASEVAMGDAQRSWFLETMQRSTKTWKIWGNEYTLTPRRADLRTVEEAPEAFRTVFLLSAEDWDGLPNRRRQLVEALSQVGGVVAITGDIHAFFAGTPTADDAGTRKIVEFVGGSISSGTYQTLLVRQAQSDPGLPPSAVALAYAAEYLLTDPMIGANPTLAHADIDRNGFMVVEATGERLEVTYHKISESHVGERLADDDEALAARFETARFKVDAGSPELYMERDGAWKRWDAASLQWV